MEIVTVGYHLEAEKVVVVGLTDIDEGIRRFEFHVRPGMLVYNMAYQDFIVEAGKEGSMDIRDGKIIEIRPGKLDLKKRAAELREYYGID